MLCYITAHGIGVVITLRPNHVMCRYLKIINNWRQQRQGELICIKVYTVSIISKAAFRELLSPIGLVTYEIN